GLELRLLDLGAVGKRMDDDVEWSLAQVLRQTLRQSRHREVAHIFVALVAADLFRRVGQGVEGRVERIDLLELEQRAVGHAARVVDLAALEQVEEDVQGRRPRAGAHGGARLGQRLGDGEAIPPIIGDAGHQRSLAAEIDAQHPPLPKRGTRKWERGTVRVVPRSAFRLPRYKKNRAATGISCGCRISACAKMRPSVRFSTGMPFTVRASELKKASSTSSRARLMR